jgi:hypothetical protein
MWKESEHESDMTAIRAGHCVVIVQACVMIVLPVDGSGSPERLRRVWKRENKFDAHRFPERQWCLDSEVFCLHVVWKERTRPRRVSHDQPGRGKGNWRNRTH